MNLYTHPHFLLRQLLFVGICALCLKGTPRLQAQEEPVAEQYLFEKQQTKGYEMFYPRPYRSLRKAWWHFLKPFGKVKIRQSHWQIHTKQGLVLYTKVGKGKKPNLTHVYLGLASGFSAEETERYAPELQGLLTSFSHVTEQKSLAKQLGKCERERKKKSRSLGQLRRREERLQTKGKELSAPIRQEMTVLLAEIEILAAKEQKLIKKLSALGDPTAYFQPE